jgi:site-specific DNA recombinase
MKAVIYTRVSSEEQVSNLSLDVQEKTCRDYCARNGWTVEAVYREEGESAKTADRTILRQLLTSLRTRPGVIEYVVVYDTSRFARDVYVHASLKQLLMKSGARLRAATQPLDDTAAGRAIEGVFAVFNQLDNELRAEKITAGMKETVTRGRWPWLAPTGYKNDNRDGRKVIVFDDQRAGLMKKAFESIAAGDAPADVLKKVTAMGLLSKTGHAIRYQELVKLLRNPFYKGITKSVAWGIETQGEHQPLIDPATWARVQLHLAGRAVPDRGHRNAQNPEFPLRGFIRCALCGTPMTASNCRGKMGRTYPYYRCWKKTCTGKVQIRAERLEAQFTELLRRLELATGMVRLLEASLQEIWKDLRATAVQETAAVRRRIADLDHRKKRYTEAYVVDQAIDRATYQREVATADEALTLLHLELHDAALEDLDLEAALGFANHVLTRTCALWEAASTEQKRRLQTLIFPKGLTFDGEALGTPATTFIFRLLAPGEAGVEELVEQKGFEPSTPTLRTWCSPS